MNFMVRPNLVKHEQNSIMMKRNARLQKLIASKPALKEERHQNPGHNLQAIPNYNIDVGYSENILSESSKSLQSIESNYRNEGQEGSFLLMLKQYEENMSLFNYEGLINNADYPKCSPELLRSLKKPLQQPEKKPLQNDYKKFELSMSDLRLDSMSLASSFNAFQINPEVFPENQTLDSKGHLLEDSDLNIIYDLTQQAQNKGNIPIKSQKMTETKRISSLQHKSKEIIPQESTHQKIAVRNFSKLTSEFNQKLSSLQSKYDSTKMTDAVQLLVSANDARKKGIKDSERDGPNSGNREVGGSNCRSGKEQGTNHKVVPTTKLGRIDLSKSPPRNPLLNSPADDHSPSPEETKRVMTEIPMERSKERRPKNQKRDPITTKITLSISPPPAKTENTAARSNNNKSIIPSIKNLVMKLSSKQSQVERLMRKPKENNFITDRPMENPFLKKYPREKESKSKKASARDADSSRQADHSQEYRPLSTTRSNKREHQTEGSFTGVNMFNKHSPRINMEAPGYSKKTPIRVRPIVSNHSNAVRLTDNEVDELSKNYKSVYKYLKKPVVSSIDPLKRSFVSRPTPERTVPHQSPQNSMIKHNLSLVKGTIARPNTRGGSMSNPDGWKKSATNETQGRIGYRATTKKSQNHQRRAVTEESYVHSSEVNLKQTSISRDHIKSTYRQLTEDDDDLTDMIDATNKKIELKINLQKMRPKSSGGTAPYTLSVDHASQILSTYRSGNTLGEETKANTRREFERYDYSHPNNESNALPSRTSKSTQSKVSRVSSQNSKTLSVSQSKNSKPVRKSGQIVGKQTEMAHFDKATELYEKLKGSTHHTSNKSVGAYPSYKHQAPNEAELAMRKGLLRKMMKSK